MKRVLPLVALSAVLVTLPLLVYPFGRDQGNYAYAAWVWLRGAALYRDVFVFKPPTTVFVHALAQALFGHSMTAIRVLDVGWTAATSVTLTLLARRAGHGVGVSGAAGALYALVYAQQSYWTTAQTDGWMNLPMLAAVLFALQPSRAWTLLAAGVSVGVAMTFKYTAAVALLPIAVVLAPQARIVGARVLLVGLGAALPLALTAGWLWSMGAWDAFVDCQVGLVSTYVSATRHFGMVEGVVYSLKLLATNEGVRTTTGLALIGLGWTAFEVTRGERALRHAVGPALFVAGLASCVSQGKLFMYHHLPIFPGLALLAAVAVVDVGGRLVARVPAQRLAWAGIAVALFATSRTPYRYVTLASIARGQPTLEEHWRTSRSYRTTDFSLRDNLALAQLTRESTTADERMFLWGFEPLVNYVAERETVSRFLYNYPFAVSWGNAAYEAELMAALAADPPALFVVSSGDATPRVTGNEDDSRALFQKFDALHAFVLDRYHPPVRARRFDVYVRADRPPLSPVPEERPDPPEEAGAGE